MSGYTNMGVPKIAYELAKDFGFVTVGFSARQALKVKSGLFPVDEVMLRGNKFGDKSEAFVAFVDLLIRVGGGEQSRHETKLFKQRFDENQLSEKLQEHEVAWLGKD